MPSSRPVGADPPPPIGGLAFEPMEAGDLEEILAIEAASFPSPWQGRHFSYEIDNPIAVNRVLRHENQVLGYACVWQVEREMKINNLAIHPDERRRGLADWLLTKLLRNAARCGCRTATLEVRVSNVAARGLYRRHGFVEVGRRPGYYQLEGEDAILMDAELST